MGTQAEILSWLKSRWREENLFKYASENYGINKICDYLATIETNAKLIRNPARDQANAAVRDAEKTLAATERGLAVLLWEPGGEHPQQKQPHPGLPGEHHPGPRRGGRRRRGAPSRSPPNCPPAASTRTREAAV